MLNIRLVDTLGSRTLFGSVRFFLVHLILLSVLFQVRCLHLLLSVITTENILIVTPRRLKLDMNLKLHIHKQTSASDELRLTVAGAFQLCPDGEGSTLTD